MRMYFFMQKCLIHDRFWKKNTFQIVPSPSTLAISGSPLYTKQALRDVTLTQRSTHWNKRVDWSPKSSSTKSNHKWIYWLIGVVILDCSNAETGVGVGRILKRSEWVSNYSMFIIRLRGGNENVIFTGGHRMMAAVPRPFTVFHCALSVHRALRYDVHFVIHRALWHVHLVIRLAHWSTLHYDTICTLWFTVHYD